MRRQITKYAPAADCDVLMYSPSSSSSVSCFLLNWRRRRSGSDKLKWLLSYPKLAVVAAAAGGGGDGGAGAVLVRVAPLLPDAEVRSSHSYRAGDAFNFAAIISRDTSVTELVVRSRLTETILNGFQRQQQKVNDDDKNEAE